MRSTRRSELPLRIFQYCIRVAISSLIIETVVNKDSLTSPDSRPRTRPDWFLICVSSDSGFSPSTLRNPLDNSLPPISTVEVYSKVLFFTIPIPVLVTFVRRPSVSDGASFAKLRFLTEHLGKYKGRSATDLLLLNSACQKHVRWSAEGPVHERRDYFRRQDRRARVAAPTAREALGLPIFSATAP